MKYDTTILNNNGSWYLRLPPTFAKHMGLADDTPTPVDAEIQDEIGKHGKYCSIWKKTV